jgi:hypothetical protein
LPRDHFMDEVAEGAPLTETKKKRQQKQKQIAHSLHAVSRGRFRLKESSHTRKLMRKDIRKMKRLSGTQPVALLALE